MCFTQELVLDFNAAPSITCYIYFHSIVGREYSWKKITADLLGPVFTIEIHLAEWLLLWIRYLCCNDAVLRLELNILVKSRGLITPKAAWRPQICPFISLEASALPVSFSWKWVHLGWAQQTCHCDGTVTCRLWERTRLTSTMYPQAARLHHSAEATCWWGCRQTIPLDAILSLSICWTAGGCAREAGALRSMR